MVDVTNGIKDLSVEELSKGYTESNEDDGYTCIFCGKVFEKGVIYESLGKLVTAERAAKEHVELEHGGSFKTLIELDKKITGLSSAQKNILEASYYELETKQISENMGISPVTVRAHKFKIQKMKREAKILLALMDQIENDEKIAVKMEEKIKKANDNEIENMPSQDLVINTLHPFFTAYRLK